MKFSIWSARSSVQSLEFVRGGGRSAPSPTLAEAASSRNFPLPRTVQLNLIHFELHFSVHSDFGSEGVPEKFGLDAPLFCRVLWEEAF